MMSNINGCIRLMLIALALAPRPSLAVLARLSDDSYTTAGSPANNGKKTTLKIQDTTNLDPSGTPQYGLIAEEVEKVMPDLVVYGNDGKPETVKYHILASLLLNELQKQHQTLDAQQTELRAVRADNAELRTQMQRIDALQAQLAELQAERRTQNLAVAR